MIKAENFNIPDHKPRILIAPLDWGLGHATRCIPIISALIQQGCTVIVAAEGRVKALLQNQFPDLQFIELRGYRIAYSRSAFWMPVKLLFQLPQIIVRIYAENRWLKRTVKKKNIDAVITDNRMGLFYKNIPCIYITHQLTIKTGNLFTEKIARKIHYHYINKFSACWVPDAKDGLSLAGELSHPEILPKAPVIYLGPLSRFEKRGAEIKFDLCIILSGPEPQRTVFEKIILDQLHKMEGRIFLVRGLPDETGIHLHVNSSLEIKNHLPAEELNNIILQSKMIISRCGYSTVMDLVKLQKNAILVPTPGQTEQEYLASFLHAQNLFYCAEQKNFSLNETLKSAASFNFSSPAIAANDFKTVIENFVTVLSH